MKQWQKEPLAFSEVLDMTFRIIKEQFPRLFLIMLILTGPVYLLDVIGRIINGTAFFRSSITGSGGSLNKFLQQLQGAQNSPNFLNGTSTGGIIMIVIAIIAGIVLTPVAYASILILVDKLRKNEIPDVKMIIKQAFSRYWGLLGGSIVYVLLMSLIFILASVCVTVIFLISGFLGISPSNLGVILSVVVLSILVIFGILYFATRWSFYFGAVTFEKVGPGIGKSWRLTKGNFWRLLGIVIVLLLITYVISAVIGAVLTFVLGKSILATLVNDLVSLITDIIIYVGYAVVYFDLRVRNEGEGLKQLIDDYHHESSGGIPLTDPES